MEQNISWFKGRYIKYVVGAAGEFLWGHEIFYAYIDGPRNILLCSICVTLFFKLKGSGHAQNI